MKSERTSISIILLLSSIFLLLSLPVKAQERKIRFKSEVEKEEAEKKLQEKAVQKENVVFFQGLSIGADVSGLLNKAFGGDYTYGGISVQANLKNRYMPVVEIGYGKIDVTNEDTQIHFSTAAPYARVGMDYNMMYKKPHLPGYIYVGGRIGYTPMKYDYDAPTLVDPNWKDLEILINYHDVKSNVTWFELVVGLKARIFKSFHMGWSLRYHSRLKMTKNENTEPHYIPGFGKGGKTNFGFAYNLIYDLPF